MEPGPSAPDETDILIVGGGIIGTATAFALSSRTGRAITLVERDQIAAGATGDSSAILRHVYGDRTVYSRMAWLGHQFYRRFEAETGYELKTPDQRLFSGAARMSSTPNLPTTATRPSESSGTRRRATRARSCPMSSRS